LLPDLQYDACLDPGEICLALSLRRLSTLSWFALNLREAWARRDLIIDHCQRFTQEVEPDPRRAIGVFARCERLRNVSQALVHKGAWNTA